MLLLIDVISKMLVFAGFDSIFTNLLMFLKIASAPKIVY